MNYFTDKYKIVSKLDDVTFENTIRHENSNRWICYSYKEAIGHKGFRFTLVDNYLEFYTFVGDTYGVVVDDYEKTKVKLTSSVIGGKNITEITCYSKGWEDLVPLPDFAIDVLRTVQTNTLYEVIRRIATAFHARLR
jgi:hypothetical protein